MSDKLSINTEISGDVVKVSFQGTMDEDSIFDKIKSLNQKRYEFDFENINSINSCGIREWISYIETISGDAEIIYKNCPQIIVEQINMVHGFIRKGATIESFYAPYFCDSCEYEGKIHLNTSSVIDSKAPNIKCPKCNHEFMDFDAIEGQYFNFLSQGK